MAMSFPLFKYNYNWQYTGVAPYHEIYLWCVETFGTGNNNWAAGWETVYFVREQDYAAFLLRWA